MDRERQQHKDLLKNSSQSANGIFRAWTPGKGHPDVDLALIFSDLYWWDSCYSALGKTPSFDQQREGCVSWMVIKRYVLAAISTLAACRILSTLSYKIILIEEVVVQIKLYSGCWQIRMKVWISENLPKIPLLLIMKEYNFFCCVLSFRY